MKTLCDLFQHQSFDYDLIEGKCFGTVGVLYATEETFAAFSRAEAQLEILRDADSLWFYFCIYLPNMREDDVFALCCTGSRVSFGGDTFPFRFFT